MCGADPGRLGDPLGHLERGRRCAHRSRPPPLGPTASLAAALVLLAMAVVFPTTIRRWPVASTLASIVGGLAAIGAVIGAFTADPALWPSDFWRYAGALLNGAGFLAALIGIWAVVTQSGR